MFGISSVSEIECHELGDLFRLESRADTDEEAGNITPEQETQKTTKAKKFIWSNQLRSLFFSSWLNALLLFVPAGFIVAYLQVRVAVRFAVNFTAIVPLSGLLGLAMRQLMMQAQGGARVSVWMIFCNIVQIIISIFLLKSRQTGVLQTYLIGSTLMLTLFNMGGAFIWGRWNNRRQRYFNKELARTMSGMLSVSVFALIVPTALDRFSVTADDAVDAFSHGTSVILIIVYLLYVVYEYTTEKDKDSEEELGSPRTFPKSVVRTLSSITGPDKTVYGEPYQDPRSDDENDEPQLSITTSIVVLMVGTVALAFNSKFMTDSIPGITQGGHITEAFIGIALIPILSIDLRAFQNVSQDKMGTVIQSSLGRSLQISLLLIPGTILIAWIMQLDTILRFDGFYMAILFASTLVVQTGISNGKSNWFLGVLFVATYLIIAVTSLYYPTADRNGNRVGG